MCCSYNTDFKLMVIKHAEETSSMVILCHRTECTVLDITKRTIIIK
jgi:hypothetical protein